MDKEKVVEVVKEGREKRLEMLATMAAVKGDEHTAMVEAGSVVINFVNMIADANNNNNGAIHPSLGAVLLVIAPDVQMAISILLSLITRGEEGKVESVVADINALLGLVEDANRKLTPGVAK